jgi:hypothetical protein
METLEDNRQQWKIEHKLKDIVVVVLVATLANCDDWVEMELWAEANEKLLKRYVPLTNGIP